MYKALESDQDRMGPALLLIAQLYRVEQQARQMAAEDRLQLRRRQSLPILDKLRDYLREIQGEVLPKSPAGRALSYALKNWTALNRYCDDGDLEIDNNATNAARGICGVMPTPGLCRLNWMKDPEFATAYRKARGAAVGQAIARLQQTTGAAVTTLQKLILDANTPAAIKGQVARAILALAIKGVEVEDLEARLAALEQAAEKSEQ
jgi:hypothetical protein